MLNIDLKALFNRLNPYCTGAMERAAGNCVTRSHYEVSIEHLLLILIEDTDRDFQLILHHYEIDPAHVARSIQHALEEYKTGNPSKPVFADLLIELFQEAWMRASLEMQLAELRSGVLIATLISNPRRYGQADYFDILKAIPADDLRRNLLNITANSKEQTLVMAVEQPAAGVVKVVREDTALGKFHGASESA